MLVTAPLLTLLTGLAGLAGLVGPPLRVPVDIGREAAAAAARLELARPEYHTGGQSLAQRIGGWVIRQVQALFTRAAEVSPGGWLGLLVLGVLVAAVVVVIRVRVGPVGRAGRARTPLLSGPPRSAAAHRAEAEALAEAGRWAEAVRERLRAVARSLTERGLLEDRPGRTADELARELARLLPEQAPVFGTSARVFDDVWYGGRTATPADYAAVRAADAAAAGPVRVTA